MYFKVKQFSQKDEIDFLKFQISQLPITDDKSDQEITKCIKEHMNLLHEYNEIKDIGQILIGKIAELKGTTSKAIYSEYDLDLTD